MFHEKNKNEVNELLKLMEENTDKYKIDNKIKNIIYNKSKSIIDHDLWYSKNDRELIYQKACELKFLSKKQKNSLSYSSINYDDDNCYNYDDGATSDEDRRWCD